MSTTSTPARPIPVSLQRAHGVTFGGILRSEWIKLRSLRSTFWCAVIILVLMLGLSALASGTLGAFNPRTGESVPLPTGADLTPSIVSAISVPTTFVSLVAAVLGALMITGEFGTGMIRSTFTAVPKRIPAVIGKAVVVTVFVFVVAAVSVLLAALLSLGIFSARGASPAPDGTFWLAMLGDAGYVALVALLSFTVGAIIRNSAGGIATALGLLLVLPIIISLLVGLAKADWARNIGDFLPSNAGQRIYSYPALAGTEAAPASGTLVLEPWQGLVVLLAWIVVLGAVALVLVRRRDA
jgi:ABC-2 type transport system permease protein